MSRVSTIHDNLISQVNLVLPDYTRLPNPYDTAENPSLYLRRGFGVGVGSASNTNRMIVSKVSIQRTFNVLLTNEVMATDLNSGSRGEFEKSLLEDQFKIITALESGVNLSGAAIKVKFDSDNGIEYAQGESKKYIFLETSFTIEYFENLT